MAFFVVVVGQEWLFLFVLQEDLLTTLLAKQFRSTFTTNSFT